MPAKLKPQKFRLLECNGFCNLNQNKLAVGVYDTIHAWYEAGWNNQKIVDAAAKLGVKVSPSTVANHRSKHMLALGIAPDAPFVPTVFGDAPKNTQPPNDLDLLNAIIAQGAESLKSRHTRISPELALKAMDMKYKLTQGSAWEGFLEAMSKPMDELLDDDEAPIEFPEEVDPDHEPPPAETL